MTEQEEWDNTAFDFNRRNNTSVNSPLHGIKSKEILYLNTDNSSTPVGSDVSYEWVSQVASAPFGNQIWLGTSSDRSDDELISMAPQGGAYDTGNRDLCPMVLSKTKHCEIPKPLLIDIVNPSYEAPTVQSAAVHGSGQSSNNAGKKIMLMKRDPKGSKQVVLKESHKGRAKQMSVAEKEKAYAAARARIFGTEEGASICSDENSNADKISECEKPANKKIGKGHGKVKVSSGPDGTFGFVAGRGKVLEGKKTSENLNRRDNTLGASRTGNEEKEEKPKAKSRDPQKMPKSLHDGSRRNSKEKKKQVVNAGEWLKDGKVKARRRAENNCDPDFQRNYDVYRPNFAPYRDSPPLMENNNMPHMISPLPPWVAEGHQFSNMGQGRYMPSSSQLPQQQQLYYSSNSSVYQSHLQQGRGQQQAGEGDFYANQLAHHQALHQQQQLQSQVTYFSPTSAHNHRLLPNVEYISMGEASYSGQSGEMPQINQSGGRLPNSSYNEHFP
eukprot:CAMPEP_0171473812 /NCGR_PEP_ID=MMETSP0946-20130122/2061_1 /TAXON_ID=109269 /ORGANISM="Vaucheria litorea, Strain CCMP2940" /LENGTH=498 /DNA_ID=CAMNT_0012003641 /DNA_START=59 /DNA_END=1552 /DNA_ORIENTATION=+